MNKRILSQRAIRLHHGENSQQCIYLAVTKRTVHLHLATSGCRRRFPWRTRCFDSSCIFALGETNRDLAHLRSPKLVPCWWLIHLSRCCPSGPTLGDVSEHSIPPGWSHTRGLWHHTAALQAVREASLMTVSLPSVSRKLEHFSLFLRQGRVSFCPSVG